MWLLRFCCLFVFSFSCLRSTVLAEEVYTSAIGDPGMRRDGLRVAIEAWNQCNEVGEEAPNMGSPRVADCFDVDNSTSPREFLFVGDSFFCQRWKNNDQRLRKA